MYAKYPGTRAASRRPQTSCLPNSDIPAKPISDDRGKTAVAGSWSRSESARTIMTEITYGLARRTSSRQGWIFAVRMRQSNRAKQIYRRTILRNWPPPLDESRKKSMQTTASRRDRRRGFSDLRQNRSRATAFETLQAGGQEHLPSIRAIALTLRNNPRGNGDEIGSHRAQEAHLGKRGPRCCKQVYSAGEYLSSTDNRSETQPF